MKCTYDFFQALGVTSTTCNSEVAACSDIIFLGVKPHLIGGILQEVASEVTHEKLVASIAAGVTLATLEQVSKLVGVTGNGWPAQLDKMQGISYRIIVYLTLIPIPTWPGFTKNKVW